MTTPLASTIQSEATKAKRLKSRNEEREGQSLSDLIAADRYLAEQAAVANGSPGFRLFRLKPPGAV